MKTVMKLRARNFLSSCAIKGWSDHNIPICVMQVTLTLWGSEAEEFDGSSNPVLAVKNGRINEYGGGKSVSLLQSSVLQINPDTTQAHKLRGWFDIVGATQEQESISGRTGAAGSGEYL
jgi:replication factor A1